MSRGVLMYAHNNSEIDYFKIACANALMVKKNLGVPVTVVTDEGSVGWARKSLGEDFVNECFDNVIIVDRDYTFNNLRNFSDTSYTSKSLQFYNCNHWEAYSLSPYDETLFIDADYLIMSDELNKCWGSNYDVLIDHRIFSPGNEDAPHTKYIDEISIKLYWATVVYFRKSEFAECLFDFVRDVQEKYAFYKDLFCFSNGMFRNDNSFSIAIHTLNGYIDSNLVVGKLPITGLMMAWDTHDIHSVPGINDIIIYCERNNSPGTYMLSRIKKQDIHIMNKWAINRHADRLIELYRNLHE